LRSASSPLSKGAFEGVLQYLRRIVRHSCRGQDGLEIQLALPRRLAFEDPQVLGPADQVLDAAHAERRQDLAHFPGHELEIVDDHFRAGR